MRKPTRSDLERKIRSKRRKRLKQAVQKQGSLEKVPQKMRYRLEREPVVFGEKGWGFSNRELSLRSLFLRPKRRGKHQSAEDFHLKLALRDAYNLSPFSSAEKTAMIEGLSRSPNDWKDFFGMFSNNEVESSVCHYSVKLTFMHALYNIGYALEKAEPIAKNFLDLVLTSYNRFLEKPVFFKQKGGKTVVKPFPKFSSFLLPLKNTNITEFIESQKPVKRPPDFVVPIVPIRGLLEYPYDVSKVKEFTLRNRAGRTIRVVSKRLSPMKSIHAEKEFENSLLVYRNLGVPCPEPVGVLKHWGNTYFLWRKIQGNYTPPNVSAAEQKIIDMEIKHQISSIKIKFAQAGIKYFDWHIRNFVITYKGTKPKVWVVDFERMEIPRKRKNGKPS